MQKEFMAAATKDPVLDGALPRPPRQPPTSTRPDQQTLVLDPAAPYKDRSVETLLAESLTPTTPAPVTTIPSPAPTHPETPASAPPSSSPPAPAALFLSFFLGVKYERN